MTQERILELAYDAQLAIWAKEKEHLDNLPDNPFTQAREQRAWNELQIIRAMMMKKQHNGG